MFILAIPLILHDSTVQQQFIAKFKKSMALANTIGIQHSHCSKSDIYPRLLYRSGGQFLPSLLFL